MKFNKQSAIPLLFITGLLLAWTGYPLDIHAPKNSITPTLIPTLISITVQPSIAPTATIDPGSIGDTSGVIALVIIVVAVILIGVLWGNHEFRMEAKKTKTAKD